MRGPPSSAGSLRGEGVAPRRKDGALRAPGSCAGAPIGSRGVRLWLRIVRVGLEPGIGSLLAVRRSAIVFCA